MFDALKGSIYVMSTCFTAGCALHTAPRSKYCAVHKSEARAAWRAMISEKSAAREFDRELLHSLVTDSVTNATSEGVKAATLAPVEPIGWVTGSPCPGQREVFYVHSGICGFAWVNIKGARGLMRQAFLDAGFSPAYSGTGLTLWVREFGQSYDRKCAFADAFVDSLRESVADWGQDFPSALKLEITSGSRLD